MFLFQKVGIWEKAVSKTDSSATISMESMSRVGKLSFPEFSRIVDAHDRAKYDINNGGGKVKGETKPTSDARNMIKEYSQQLPKADQKVFEVNLTKAYASSQGIPNVRKEIVSNPKTLDDIKNGTFKMPDGFIK